MTVEVGMGVARRLLAALVPFLVPWEYISAADVVRVFVPPAGATLISETPQPVTGTTGLAAPPVEPELVGSSLRVLPNEGHLTPIFLHWIGKEPGAPRSFHP